jgi:hypothetical protein
VAAVDGEVEKPSRFQRLKWDRWGSVEILQPPEETWRRIQGGEKTSAKKRRLTSRIRLVPQIGNGSDLSLIICSDVDMTSTLSPMMPFHQQHLFWREKNPDQAEFETQVHRNGIQTRYKALPDLSPFFRAGMPNIG